MNFEPILSLVRTSSWLASIECLFSCETREIYNKIKLTVIILIFSANPQVLNKDLHEQYHTYILQKLQTINIYLLWKYML